MCDEDQLTCSICLGDIDNISVLDQCFHKFCTFCILQWLEISSLCPLCKTPNNSIVTSFDDKMSTYERIWIEDKDERSRKMHAFGRVLTKTVRSFLRKRIYDMNLKPIVHYKERSQIDFGKLNPWLRRELIMLLNYDVVKIGKDELESELTIIMEFVRSLIKKYGDISKVAEAKQQLEIFLFENTETFCKEVMTFLKSPYDTVTFDAKVRYIEG